MVEKATGITNCAAQGVFFLIRHSNRLCGKAHRHYCHTTALRKCIKIEHAILY